MERRVPWRAAVVAAVALLALLLPARALAHAQLVKTEPGNDAVLPEQPRWVTLRFNEPVETAFGSVRVYDSQARRIDAGDVTRSDERSVEIGVEDRLRDGTYTVTWRAISADGHPVSGAFVFHVGAPGANPAGIASVLDEDTPREVTVTATVLRFLDFALILLVGGGAVALAWPLAAAAPALRRRLARVLGTAAAVLALVALAGIVLQGAAAGGFGIGEAARWPVVRAVLDTRFGEVWLAQAGVAAVLAVFASVRGDSRRAAPFTILLAALLVITPALAGHAHVRGTVATVADVAHVAAGAVWTGGLAVVVLALAWARADRWALAAGAVPRFSLLAVYSVAALVVAGAVNGYLQVGALRGLWETTYGWLLVAKIALVLPLLALGAYNNRYAVPRLRHAIASTAERRRFLQTTSVELGLFVAIVAVTAVLVAEPPARATVAPRGPYATETTLGTLNANVVVDPGRTGANTIHVYLLDPRGRPSDVSELDLAAMLPSREVGPLRFPGHRLAPGHYAVHGADLALPGDWQLRLTARRGEFEAFDNTIPIPIRED
jgi:copper transport protein